MTPAPQILINGQQLLALNTNLDRIQQWLIPGSLSLRFALLQISLENHLKALYRLTTALQDQHAAMIPGEDGKQPQKKLTPIYQQGTHDVVGHKIEMKDQQLFDQKYNELLDEEMTVQLPHLLTLADFDRIDHDMLENVASLIPPHLASFAPVIDITCRLATSTTARGATDIKKRR